MAAKKEGITKTEALRKALAELGQDAGAEGIKDFITKNFGISFGPEFHTMKAQVRKEFLAKSIAAAAGNGSGNGNGSVPATATATAAAPAPPAPAPPPPAPAAQEPLVEPVFLAQLRNLVRLIGAAHVKRIIDAL